MLIAAAIVLSGQKTSPHVARHRQITDMTGRPVQVPATPRRVLSLCTSATDTLLALGQRDLLAAIDEYSRVVPQSQSIPVIGKGSALSRERVVALGIDLALVWWYQDDAAALLQDLGIPVVRLGAARAAQIPAMVRLIGQCVNASEAAEPLARQLEDFLQAITPAPTAHAAPKVFLELYGPYKTAGRETYADDLLQLAGGRNIAAASTGPLLFSPEQLIAEDPEVILFVDEFANAAGLARRGGWSGLSAVQSGRILPIPRYWLVAGPGLPDAVGQLRRLLSSPLGSQLGD